MGLADNDITIKLASLHSGYLTMWLADSGGPITVAIWQYDYLTMWISNYYSQIILANVHSS